jgi:chemotaxis protein MotB
MALGRGRRDRGGIDAWPGYVDALSTLLILIIFVLLVFVLSQGFLSLALSSRDRALDRLNRQVAELGELLALERGQAEELRGALGRTNDELRAAATARDAAQRSLSLLRDERDRLAAERDTTRGERDRLAARLADLEASARGGSARIAELEGRLAEALARAEAVGGDAARTARTLTDAQRLLAAERAALEAVRRDLAAARDQSATLGRDLDAERRAREARERDLAAAQSAGQGLTRELAAEREVLAARLRDLEASRDQAQALARDLAAARQQLEAARRDIASLREEQAKLDQTVQADRATIEARLSDIARLAEQLRALAALRDQLERQAAEALARAEEQQRQRTAAQQQAAEAARRATESDQQRSAAQRAAEDAARARAAAEALVAQATGRTTEAERQRAAAAQLAADATARAADAERRRQAAEAQSGEFARLSESARAQVALLTGQLEQLRREMARLNAALDASEAEGRDRDAQIALLGQRLNAALAARVEELQSYRSDFFGRLRRVIGERPEVRIVGDRFVFQSEVLFPVGSAEMSPAGQQQIRDLARVLLDLAAQFPRDLSWVLRVDGHADRSPIRGGGRFANNWELSAARSIAVAQLLIEAGLPRNRVAAAAFGDTQPLDDRETPEAYARNRRIELRLEAGPTANAGEVPSPARAP